jgi:hypothetical protein
MSDVKHLTYVKAVSNSIVELKKRREAYDEHAHEVEFTMLEAIKNLLMLRLIKPFELSVVAINLLTSEDFFRKHSLTQPSVSTYTEPDGRVE